MAFMPDGLSRNGSGQGNSQAVWAYHTTDPYVLISSDGYFDEAQSKMQRGDLLFVWDDTLGVATLTYVATSSVQNGVNLATGLTITA